MISIDLTDLMPKNSLYLLQIALGRGFHDLAASYCRPGERNLIDIHMR